MDGENRDQIALVTFQDPSLLQKQGKTFFANETQQDEIEARQSQIHQGALEASNVNLMEEMVQLIDSQRTLESCTRMIQVNDELNAKAVNELGKL